MGLACVSHTQEQSGQYDTNGVEAEVSKSMHAFVQLQYRFGGTDARKAVLPYKNALLHSLLDSHILINPVPELYSPELI